MTVEAIENWNMIRNGDKISFEEYCKDRRNPLPNEWSLYFEEVNTQCPICGRKFLYQVKTSLIKGAEIAHVFPNSPTASEKKILKDVEVDGVDSESFENKIALCKNCHDEYDAKKTVESYNQMLELKRRLYAELKAKKMLSDENIEAELTAVVKELSKARQEDLDGSGSLNYSSLKISQKVDIVHLCKRIEGDVSAYYPFCKQKFKEVDSTGCSFDIVCLSVKRGYKKLKKEGLDKETIFEKMTSWFVAKTHASYNACAIMVSFFVQNCDVYDEIS